MRRRSSYKSAKKVIRKKSSGRRRNVHRVSVKNNAVMQWSFQTVLYTVLLVILAYGLLHGYMAVRDVVTNSERLKIRTISMDGGKNILSGEIIPLLPFDVGDHILFQDLGKARKNILEIKPELKDIRISRGWESVKVRIIERTPVAVIGEKEARQGVDSDNRLFPLRGAYIKSALPEMVAPTREKRAELLKFIKRYSKRAPALFAETKKLYLISLNNIVIESNDGYKIFWGPYERGAFSNKLKRLKQVLSDAVMRFDGIEYINLSYLSTERVLVKPTN